MRTYDPGKIVAVWGGIQLSGFADSTFLKAARTNESFKLEPGADGEITRTRSRNRSGKVTFTLKQEVPANDLLSAQIAMDEATGLGVAPLLVTDLGGTTLLRSVEAFLEKPADVEYGKDSATREWTILCKDLLIVVGGEVDVQVVAG